MNKVIAQSLFAISLVTAPTFVSATNSSEKEQYK